MKKIEEQFIDWENAIFGFGYGTGEQYTIQGLKDFFDQLENDRNYDYEKVEKKFGQLAGWLLINILCRADILEYGTSARFGWVTEKGAKLRDFLKTRKTGELYELVMNVADGYPMCGKNYCNCNPPESFDKKCSNNEFF